VIAPPAGMEEVATLVQPAEHENDVGVLNVSVGTGGAGCGLSLLQDENVLRIAVTQQIKDNLNIDFFILVVFSSKVSPSCSSVPPLNRGFLTLHLFSDEGRQNFEFKICGKLKTESFALS
jgi:hypothetical protein